MNNDMTWTWRGLAYDFVMFNLMLVLAAFVCSVVFPLRWLDRLLQTALEARAIAILVWLAG